jgi:DNA-binding PadR family transcriptional regulator
MAPTTPSDWPHGFDDAPWSRLAHHVAGLGSHRGTRQHSPTDEPHLRHHVHLGRSFEPGFGPRFGRGFRGGPPFFNAFFGPGGPGRGPRRRRGDVRAAILALLREEPRNGYQLIQEIDRRTDGMWRASAGSVYPALQQLEDEGLVEATDESGRRSFRLTDAGRSYADQHADELAAPWASVAEGVDEDARSLFETMAAVGAATVQVSRAGTGTQVARARRLLVDTRKALYRILAEEPGTGDPGQTAG